MFLIILIITLSLDTLIAGFSIGLEKIKVPIFSIVIINMISTLFLFLSFLLGIKIISFLPVNLINYLPPIIFILLGLEKLLENVKTISLKSSNLADIYKIYKHPKKADLDNSKTLSLKELIFLSIALSLDNFLIGISFINYKIYLSFIIIFHFLFGFILFYILNRISIRIKINKSINSSVISGIIFIIVGIYRIFA